tara:strand:- start:2843 stop:4537 length:1695 start_codon:yes stop_codon:yes gene_type:complete
MTLALWIVYCIITLPDLTGLGNKTRKPSISVLNNKNEIMGSLGDVYAGSVSLQDISSHLTKTVIIIEDRRFFSHKGIDIKGLVRAVLFNIKEGRYAQGASTITQQLSKLIFLNSNKNLSRKMRELLISFYLEYNFTKSDILTMYLNRVYFGSGLYGVKSASRRYFTKSPNDLSLAESAILAGTLKAPSKLSLLTNRDSSIKRAKLIISLLFSKGIIQEDDVKSANKELDYYLQNTSKSKAINARYFIDWIYTQTPEGTLRSKKDLLIRSTLDSKIQDVVNEAVDNVMTNIDNEQIQAAVVVMNYKGAIKALKGGKSWNKSKFNRATQSKRQIGSIFKTYVYLTALDNGAKINDYVLDTPINRKEWSPKNFGNNYEGKITIKRAFAKSSNVAAVRLSDTIGRDLIISQIRKLGVISNIPDEPSMALGVASMSLLEVVGSYAPICGEGKPIIPYAIKEIILRDGSSYWKRIEPKRKKIIKSSTSYKIKGLLNEVVKKGTAKKLSKFSFKIIGKTGTTQNNRDAWFIGCAKGHVIGVWNGRDDDKSMKNVFGSTLPLEIFSNIINKI